MKSTLGSCITCGHSLSSWPDHHVNAAVHVSPSMEELLHSIRPPTVSEKDILRTDSDIISADIRRLDEHIGALRTRLDELTENRMVLRGRFQRYKSALSPLRRVPIEILTNIFNMNDGNPLVLSHVSRLWRTLALATPTLWTRIDHPFSWDQLLHVDFTKHRLSLSRDRLLSVTLSTCSNYLINTISHPTTRLLLSESHRWKKLTLHLEQGGWDVDDVKDRLPNLRTLVFGWHAPVTSINLFENTPNLRNVDLGGFSMSVENWRKIRLPWHTLSQLKIRVLDHVIFECLRECPNLTHCHLAIIGPMPSGISLVHSTLTSLTLVEHGQYDAFWEFAIFPNLVEFRLEHNSISSEFSHLPLFLSRCSQTLRRLSLSSSADHDLAACFEAAPRIMDLCLEYRSVTSLVIPVLRRLTFRPSSSEDVLLPELESLELLNNKKTADVIHSDLEAMILSRCRSDLEDSEGTGSFTPSRRCATLRRVAIKTGTFMDSLRRGPHAYVKEEWTTIFDS